MRTRDSIRMELSVVNIRGAPDTRFLETISLKTKGNFRFANVCTNGDAAGVHRADPYVAELVRELLLALLHNGVDLGGTRGTHCNADTCSRRKHRARIRRTHIFKSVSTVFFLGGGDTHKTGVLTLPRAVFQKRRT